jgi:hypothetical protein
MNVSTDAKTRKKIPRRTGDLLQKPEQELWWKIGLIIAKIWIKSMLKTEIDAEGKKSGWRCPVHSVENYLIIHVHQGKADEVQRGGKKPQVRFEERKSHNPE